MFPNKLPLTCKLILLPLKSMGVLLLTSIGPGSGLYLLEAISHFSNHFTFLHRAPHPAGLAGTHGKYIVGNLLPTHPHFQAGSPWIYLVLIILYFWKYCIKGDRKGQFILPLCAPADTERSNLCEVERNFTCLSKTIGQEGEKVTTRFNSLMQHQLRLYHLDLQRSVSLFFWWL